MYEQWHLKKHLAKLLDLVEKHDLAAEWRQCSQLGAQTVLFAQTYASAMY